MTEFKDLVGKVFHTVTVEDDEIHFMGDVCSYKLLHIQDCCEHVYIESIDGDIVQHLPNTEILDAYESYSRNTDYDSSTWSFYTIRTMRDTFLIRFFGSSNGYYSEEACLVESSSVPTPASDGGEDDTTE